MGQIEFKISLIRKQRRRATIKYVRILSKTNFNSTTDDDRSHLQCVQPIPATERAYRAGRRELIPKQLHYISTQFRVSDRFYARYISLHGVRVTVPRKHQISGIYHGDTHVRTFKFNGPTK